MTIRAMTAEDYQPASLEELIDALDELVTELVRYRNAKKHDPREPMRAVSFAELCKVPDGVLRQRSLVDDPVVWALKRGIKEIGELMYNVTKSTRVMSKIVNDVCERDEKYFGQRVSPIDSVFNGIGSGNDVWVS